ncbi:MAG: mechanosensitive ion channel family protein [Chitinophagales bacterium]
MEEQITDQAVSSWNNMLDRLAGWFDAAVTNLPNFILAMVVFGLTYWLSRNLQYWINKPLKRVVKQPSVRELISNFLAIIVIGIGLFLALGILNLDTVLKSLLAGAGVAGLAIGLALQGTLSNTFSGIFLAVKDIMNVGDFVETNGYSGSVVEIGLRNTKVKETDNNIVVIPNRMVLENPFKNYGLTDRVRVTLKCGVGYESDLEEVKNIAIDSIARRFPPQSPENIEFHYLEFGGSSIDFQMRFWVDAKEKLSRLEAHSEAMMLLKKAFDNHDINIPFPIRTLQMSESPAIRIKEWKKNGVRKEKEISHQELQ